MAQATFSVSFGAIHLDREQLSQLREGVHHNGYIIGHLALVKMQDTGAGTADKFKIMGDNENDLSKLRQPPDQPATWVMLSKSRPLVGSSNTSRSFPQIMLTATATRCFCPPDSVLGWRSR